MSFVRLNGWLLKEMHLTIRNSQTITRWISCMPLHSYTSLQCLPHPLGCLMDLLETHFIANCHSERPTSPTLRRIKQLEVLNSLLVDLCHWCHTVQNSFEFELTSSTISSRFRVRGVAYEYFLVEIRETFAFRSTYVFVPFWCLACLPLIAW